MGRDEFRLKHIRDAVDAIERHTADVDHDGFMKSELIQHAVLHEIMVIGEAANNLSEEFIEKHHDIPW
jgi:uncharacterized protein with HEPN domain